MLLSFTTIASVACFIHLADSSWDLCNDKRERNKARGNKKGKKEGLKEKDRNLE